MNQMAGFLIFLFALSNFAAAKEFDVDTFILNELSHLNSRNLEVRTGGGFELRLHPDRDRSEMSHCRDSVDLVLKLFELAPRNIMPMALEGIQSEFEHVRIISITLVSRWLAKMERADSPMQGYDPFLPVTCDANVRAISYYGDVVNELLI